MRYARTIDTGFDSCLIGFGGRQDIESAMFDPSTLSAGGVDEVQTLTVTGGPGGGSFTLTYKNQTTSAIPYNASAAVVQAALRALLGIGPTGVTVTGSGGGPWTLAYGGGLGKRDIAPLVVDPTGLTGGTSPNVTVTETTKGDASYSGLYVITSGLILAKTADGKYMQEYTGAGDINEVQTVTETGTPAGGTIILAFDGEQTGTIPFNASAATVQTALEALPNIDPGDVLVTGGAGPGTPWVVTFMGQYQAQSVPLMTAASALTGGTTPGVGVAQTTQGGTTQAIEGIFEGYREFLAPTREAAKLIPVYGRNATFNKNKIKNYAAHAGALAAWGKTVDATFRVQNN